MRAADVRLGATPGKGPCLSRELLIAVVDDDESFRTALVESLGSRGYEAQGFASAEEFIATGAFWSCVVTDVHMPGMGGFDLSRRLTAQSARVPVVMITARSEVALDAHAAASGAICLLRKPFEVDALIDCLQRALAV